MRVFVSLLLLSLAYLANQAASEKVPGLARVDGRLTGHVTFSEQVLLHREKRQGRGRRPPPANRRPRPTPQPTQPTQPPTAPPTAPTTRPPPVTTQAATQVVTQPITQPITSGAPATSPTNPPTSSQETPATCGTEVYRSSDGSCNNVGEPQWGAKDSAFQRMLQPVYGANSGPVLDSAVDGTALPSARLVSRIIHDPSDRPERRPVMSMQWGQFLDHDITSTPVNPASVTCCYDGIIASGVQQHPDVAINGPCFPILIPTGDNHFTSLEARCMESKRSFQTTVNGQAEQINLVSAFIDGSQVYGSSDAEMEELRSSTSGRGRLLDINDHLPKADSENCIVNDATVDYCLKAGDFRVNVYPGLGALHTVFLRMHNRIADGLADANADWSDDEVFNEARRIVGALLQKITYSEWLPSVLGPAATAQYRLSSDVDYTYEPGRNPTLYNVFSTAAFRFGHSMITDTLTINDDAIESIDLLNNPHHVLHSLDALLTGILEDPAQRVDRWYSRGMTNHMFETVPFKGLDIVSLNVQRGRDHGLPRYNAWREECGLGRFTVFGDLVREGPRFQRVYRNVDDIDLYSGALHELPVEQGIVGETYACLIGRQFENLKFGDRFWYQNTNAPNAFTNAQIAQIDDQSLASVLCQTTGLEAVRANAFMNDARNNPVIDCRDVSPIDYSLF